MRLDTCRDSDADRNLTTIDALSASSLNRFQGEGMKRIDSSSGLENQGVTCFLKEAVKMSFSHPDPF